MARTGNDNDRNRPADSDPEFTGKGAYVPPGEGGGEHQRFTARQVANAFGVGIGHVHEAMEGEFGFPPDGLIDSTQARRLTEVLLTDRPLEQREAVLMKLGAFTPRRDHEFGVGEIPPDVFRERHHLNDDDGDATGRQ